MRTLEHLSLDKQRRIALETREIFAPLANRLGIGCFKWSWKICLSNTWNRSLSRNKALVAQRRSDREKRIEEAVERLRARLEEMNCKIIQLEGRPNISTAFTIKCSGRIKNLRTSTI